MSIQPQSKPSGSVIFFSIGGALCVVFVIVMGLLAQQARQPKTIECFSGTTIGDVWFTPHLRIATDLAAEPFDVQTQGAYENLSVAIANPSNEPLYWVEKIPGHPASWQKVWTDALGTPIPPGINVHAKVISNTVSYASTYEAPQIQWNVVYGQMLVVSAQYFFEDQNRRENDRPAAITVPQSQSHDLSLLYDGQFIDATMIFTYSLNTTYNPKQAQSNPRNLPYCGSVGDFRVNDLGYSVSILFCVVGYIVTLVLFLVGVWIRNVWQKK